LTIVILDQTVLKEQVVNRAFVALAIEAGIETTIKSLVTLAATKEDLLVQVKTALAVANPPLAAALGIQTLEAILKYITAKEAVSAVVMAEDLPELLDENGPASVSAARDGGLSTQVNVSFTAPQNGYVPEIYLDGIYQKDSTVAPSGGFMHDAIQNVGAGAHTIRVLYRHTSTGGQTRFGPIANIPS
jgi:hypothetical protein